MTSGAKAATRNGAPLCAPPPVVPSALHLVAAFWLVSVPVARQSAPAIPTRLLQLRFRDVSATALLSGGGDGPCTAEREGP